MDPVRNKQQRLATTHTMLCLSPCRALLCLTLCFVFFSARCDCHLDKEDVPIPDIYTTNMGLNETGQVKRAIGGTSYRCRARKLA